jgi:hypothetical protein
MNCLRVGTAQPVYWLDNRPHGPRFNSEKKDFSLFQNVQTGTGAHQRSYEMGTSGSFSRAKSAGGEADHSPLPSAAVKYEWFYAGLYNMGTDNLTF